MKPWTAVALLVAQLIIPGFRGDRRAWAQTPLQIHPAAPRGSGPAAPSVPFFPSVTPATGIPDDVQLVGADTDPTLRFPVCHTSWNGGTLIFHFKTSYGWLEVRRGTVRYVKVRQSARTKEEDAGFEFTRAEATGLRIDEYSELEFRYQKLRHYLQYAPATHWDVWETSDAYQGVPVEDRIHTPVVMRALQDFDGVVADVKRKQQVAAAPPPVPAEPKSEPSQPKPEAAPPTIVLTVPSGAGENRTVEVNESPLTVRGVAIDSSGLPTITINGAPAALRPQTAQAAEFWSDPLALQPGDNPVEIVATNSGQSKATCRFVVHFTRKEAPANPRALSRDEIISLLSGGVDSGRVVGLVKERGVKFSPTPQDFDAIRAAGGKEDLVQAIQAAAAGK
jgi:hypothetical protein